MLPDRHPTRFGTTQGLRRSFSSSACVSRRREARWRPPDPTSIGCALVWVLALTSLLLGGPRGEAALSVRLWGGRAGTSFPPQRRGGRGATPPRARECEHLAPGPSGHAVGREARGVRGRQLLVACDGEHPALRASPARGGHGAPPTAPAPAPECEHLALGQAADNAAPDRVIALLPTHLVHAYGIGPTRSRRRGSCRTHSHRTRSPAAPVARTTRPRPRSCPRTARPRRSTTQIGRAGPRPPPPTALPRPRPAAWRPRPRNRVAGRRNCL